MSGKRYPEEFKIKAIKQVDDREPCAPSVATRLVCYSIPGLFTLELAG